MLCFPPWPQFPACTTRDWFQGLLQGKFLALGNSPLLSSSTLPVGRSPISRSLNIWAASVALGGGGSRALVKGFLGLTGRRPSGPVYGEEPLGGLCWVGPAVAAQARRSSANQSLLYNHAGRDVQGPVGGVHVWGGGFLFKRQGGWNGGSQLAVGSISTDKALPCRCEEFQLNMQPICLCVGEGLLEGGGWRQRLCSKPEISSVHHRHTHGASLSPPVHSQESREGDRQRKLERGWGGGFPAGRASGISEWAGRRIARLLGSWGFSGCWQGAPLGHLSPLRRMARVVWAHSWKGLRYTWRNVCG